MSVVHSSSRFARWALSMGNSQILRSNQCTLHTDYWFRQILTSWARGAVIQHLNSSHRHGDSESTNDARLEQNLPRGMGCSLTHYTSLFVFLWIYYCVWASRSARRSYQCLAVEPQWLSADLRQAVELPFVAGPFHNVKLSLSTQTLGCYLHVLFLLMLIEYCFFSYWLNLSHAYAKSPYERVCRPTHMNIAVDAYRMWLGTPL